MCPYIKLAYRYQSDEEPKADIDRELDVGPM